MFSFFSFSQKGKILLKKTNKNQHSWKTLVIFKFLEDITRISKESSVEKCKIHFNAWKLISIGLLIGDKIFVMLTNIFRILVNEFKGKKYLM